MSALLAFLTKFLPLLAKYAPGLIVQARDIFKSVGGEDADFDQILADNQKDIDKLANPDQFRHAPHAPAVPHISSGMYEIVMTGDRPQKPEPSDLLFQFGEESRWFLRQAGVGLPAPPPPWHLVED